MTRSSPGARLLALLALVALPALAQGRSARLLEGADAPVLAALNPTGTALHLLPAANDVAPEREGPSYGEHFAKTLGVSMLATSTGLVVGAGLGKLSINLAVSAGFTLLSNLLIGPIFTVLAAMLIGNDGSFSGRYGFWGGFAVAAVLNAALFVLTSLVPAFAVSWANPLANLVYSLVDGLLMTGGTVGLMHLTAKKPVAAVLPSFVPGVTDTQIVSVGKVDF